MLVFFQVVVISYFCLAVHAVHGYKLNPSRTHVIYKCSSPNEQRKISKSNIKSITTELVNQAYRKDTMTMTYSTFVEYVEKLRMNCAFLAIYDEQKGEKIGKKLSKETMRKREIPSEKERKYISTNILRAP